MASNASFSSFFLDSDCERGQVGPGDLSWAEASFLRWLVGPGSAIDEIASEPIPAADIRGGEGHDWVVAKVAASTMSAADKVETGPLLR